MSRTKRYIPHWARFVHPYEYTWIGLGIYIEPTGSNPRNRYENGYDKRKSLPPVWEQFRYKKGWVDRDTVSRKSRKMRKQNYHRGRRRVVDKLLIMEGIRDFLPE